ncbi:hypothetical protein [Isoptericola haloaureus]|uniref:DUF4913 domain-containing protein n=1 Tax=Isoptericola haloaureus TaxID=1542902 RepID=A0ABU7Z5B3_9MICO
MGYDGNEQAWGPGTRRDATRVSRPPQVSHGDGGPPANDPFSRSGGLGPFAKAKGGGWARVDAMFPVQHDPGVFSWMDADVATRAAAMQRLDRFVEWLCATFAFGEVITPCWSLHPAIVQELWALERYHRLAHDDGANLAEPVRWLNQLASTRTRLGAEWRARACDYQHVEPIAEAASRIAERRGYYLVDYWPDGEIPLEDPPGGFAWQRWSWPDVDESGAEITPPDHIGTGRVRNRSGEPARDGGRGSPS